MRSFCLNSRYGQGTFRREASPQLVRVPLKVYWFENCLGAFHLSEVVNLPWVPEVFSCVRREHFFGPKAKPTGSEAFRAGHDNDRNKALTETGNSA